MQKQVGIQTIVYNLIECFYVLIYYYYYYYCGYTLMVDWVALQQRGRVHSLGVLLDNSSATR